MKILLIGAGGQLGKELQLTKPDTIELLAYDRQQLDVTQSANIETFIKELKPDCIINASAYTAVDDAESQQQIALAVNAEGPAYLAKVANQHDSRLIHISTDYVFDGYKNSPYDPEDIPNPQNYYGLSKLIGEKKIQDELAGKALIIRTSTVYSQYGKNFVKAMLHYFSEREKISMVADQIATPTWARALADAIWRAVEKNNLAGIYHFTDAGCASKYDFAVAIQEEALHLQLLPKAIPIFPIKTEEFPTPAKRPLYAVLDKAATWHDFVINPVHWRVRLREMLLGLKENNLANSIK